MKATNPDLGTHSFVSLPTEVKEITKREYFAVHILAGILSDVSSHGGSWGNEAVRSAIKYADKLIIELNQTKYENSKRT